MTPTPAVGDSRLTAVRRRRDLDALGAGEVVDVLVVGGGVTGAGVALDAASRGLSVALVERHDLAAGTSRWSSKLAHGGVRYIGSGQVGVAWESAVERNRLATVIAPHLIRPMPFLLPDLPSYSRFVRAGSSLVFGVAAALRAASQTPTWLPRSRWADAAEVRALAPAVVPGRRGARVHVDGALEDDARLVVAIARTAAAHGARILTHVEALEVARDSAVVRDAMTGQRLDLRARAVVVAAGVWSDRLIADVTLRPSKGSHLIVRAEALGCPTAAVNIVVPGTFNRFVFAVPRPDGTVMVGLTDDPVEQVEDVPSVTADEEQFLLTTLSSGLSLEVTADDVIGRYAGLRPLLAGDSGASSADLSRRHALLDRDGVLVIVGGKLTTYRRMAQDAVDKVVRALGRGEHCRTASLPLVGAEVGAGLRDASLPARLHRRYGAEAAAVAGSRQVGSFEPIAPGVPVLRCEVDWAIAAEGAMGIDDVLDGRLRLDLVTRWRAAAAPVVSEAFPAAP